MTTIDIKMSSIYNASRGVLPANALVFSFQAEGMALGVEATLKQLSLAGNPVMADTLGLLASEIYFHLRSASEAMGDVAMALDRIADDFVKTDADAHEWMKKNHARVGSAWIPPIPPADPGF